MGTQNALFHFKNPPLMDEAIDCAWKRSAGREGPTGDMTYFEVGLREKNVLGGGNSVRERIQT